jgi:hypothetical protein
MRDEDQHKAREEVYHRNGGYELSPIRLSRELCFRGLDLVSMGICGCLLGTFNAEFVRDIFSDAFKGRYCLLQPEFILISLEHLLFQFFEALELG